MKLNNKIRAEIVEQIVKILKERYLLDNVSFLYNNKLESYGSSSTDFESEDLTDIPGELEETKEGVDMKAYGCDENTIMVMYDGGALYSSMSGEFGYDSGDRFKDATNEMLSKYNLYIEEYDNVSFVLAEL
jgi:hypothetical protein